MWQYSLFAFLGIAAASAAAQQPSAGPGRCDAPEYRLIDYMIGNWRIVETANGKHFADDRVEPVHDGCALRENLRLPDGTVGSALAFFKPLDRLWHVYYHDSSGLSGHITGYTDPQGRQELSGDTVFPPQPRRTNKFRQTQMKDDAGRPRQIGYILNDKDLSWQQIYDVTFCPMDRRDPRNKPPCR